MNGMRLGAGTVLITVVLFALACSGESFDDSAATTNEGAERAALTDVEDKSAPQQPAGSEPEQVLNQQVTLDDARQSADEAGADTRRMIIRNAHFVLESGSPGEVQKTIEQMTERLGGYVIEATKRSGGDSLRGGSRVLIDVRIPAEKFSSALEEVRKSADRVVLEEVKGEDVTEKFVDIQARLKAKSALEERFLDIMKQSKNVQDALNVQRELATVRLEIERIEGQKRLLENLAKLSRIKIEINPPNTVTSSSSGFWYQFQEAVSDGFEGALTFVLYLVRIAIALVPFFLLIILPVLLVLRYLWRKYRKHRLAREIAKETGNIIDDDE